MKYLLYNIPCLAFLLAGVLLLFKTEHTTAGGWMLVAAFIASSVPSPKESDG